MPDTGSNTKLKKCSKVWVYGRDIKAFFKINVYNSKDKIKDFSFTEPKYDDQNIIHLGMLKNWRTRTNAFTNMF